METLAIIINYMSACLTLQAVQSVLNSSSIGPVHVIVIDNSEDEEEVQKLRLGLPLIVTLKVNAQNIGFGRACNQAFEQFSGEFILLINPDARLLSGCLVSLQNLLLAIENVGAVAPKVFWDDGLSYLLPPSYPPALFLFESLLGKFGPQSIINRLFSGIWRDYSIKGWRSNRPSKMSNLSGSVVLLKREAIVRAQGLFDPRFFLYFEDTDLFMRLKKAGYTLFMEPNAKAIHHYNQCDTVNGKDKRSIFKTSYKIFLEKYIKGLKFRGKKLMGYRKAPINTKGGDLHESVFTSPFMLEIPTPLRDGWLFEFSPNRNFVPSVGRFGKGSTMDFPIDCWAMLTPGRYYGRLGSVKGILRPQKTVSWIVQ